MKINNENVKHLAKLSRLNFTDSELEKFKGEFQQILDYFEVLVTE